MEGTIPGPNGYDLSWELAYKLSDLALPFSLTPPIAHRSPAGLSVDDLAASHAVSFLQTNGRGDGFNIVAFDNVQNLYQPTTGNGAPVGGDIANLFGQGLAGPHKDQICVGTGSDQVCVSVPSPQIFELNALEQTAATWQ